MVSTRVARILCAALAVALLSGCIPRPKAQVSWPRADSERTVSAAPTVTRWALTGLPAGIEGDTVPRPVVVPVPLRTSAGLETADVVVEWPGSSNTPRLHAAFQSVAPGAPFGPVGAATPLDMDLASAFGGALAHTGALPATVASPPLDAGQSALPRAYRQAPGALQVDVDAVQREVSDGYAGAPVFTWDEKVPAGADPSSVRDLSIPYAANDIVVWKWDKAEGVYVRTGVGGPTGKVTAVNVVVVWAFAQAGGTAPRLDRAMRASLFRGGRKVVGRAVTAPAGTLRFMDGTDQPLPLAPGNTWVELVPNAVDITLK
jgi:hypothetical protein